MTTNYAYKMFQSHLHNTRCYFVNTTQLWTFSQKQNVDDSEHCHLRMSTSLDQPSFHRSIFQSKAVTANQVPSFQTGLQIYFPPPN
jgi:hypothetical protein